MQKKLSSRKFYIHEYAEKRCMEDYAKEQLEIGEARGEIRGRNEGISIGREEGIKQTTLELAKNMLKENISTDVISKVTGLSKKVLMTNDINKSLGKDSGGVITNSSFFCVLERTQYEENRKKYQTLFNWNDYRWNNIRYNNSYSRHYNK